MCIFITESQWIFRGCVCCIYVHTHKYLYIWVHLPVCVLFICSYMHSSEGVYTLTHACASVETTGRHWVSYYWPPSLFRQSLTASRTHPFWSMAGEWVPWVCSCCAQVLGLHLTFMWVWGSKFRSPCLCSRCFTDPVIILASNLPFLKKT